MSMNDEQFETTMEGLPTVGLSDTAAQLRARDTAQREALGRVEAERASNQKAIKRLERQLDAALDECDTAQAQLAEAVGLLEKVTDTTGWDLRDGPLISQVHDFLVPHREAAFMKAKGVRHAQAEQQEAQGDGHD